MSSTKQPMRHAISICPDNFDVVVDDRELLQVKCTEGRFIVESFCKGNPVSLLQGNEIILYHGKIVYIGNGFTLLGNKDIMVKIYFEDLSNLLG